MFDKEHVHVLRTGDREAQTEWFRACLKALCRVRTKEVIAIKPNLGSALPAQTGATTSLWMLEETIKYVRSRRARPVVIEGPSHIHNYQQVLDVTGAGALYERLGVDHVDGRTDGMPLRPLKHDDPSGRSYHVNMALLGADGIICLPKLKTHNRTDVTLGIKGLMGLLAAADRHGFHRRGVSDDIVELFKRLRSRIRGVFVDGLIGMEGHGPTCGRPVAMDLIIAGKDMVSVDAVGAMIMGFEPEDVHHIRSAYEQGLGDSKRAWVMHPTQIPLPVRPFERARASTGLRTQVMTFPPFSSLLRLARMGVRGRTKPVVREGVAAGPYDQVAAVCPTGAIDSALKIDYDRCIGCGLCIEVCPEALRPEGRTHKLGRLVQELTGL